MLLEGKFVGHGLVCRWIRMGALALVLSLTMAISAPAQSACAQLGVDCSNHGGNQWPGGSTTNDEPRPNPIDVWADRIRRMKERAAQRKAEAQAKAKVKAEAKARADADASAAVRAREEAERRRHEEQLARERDAERQRLAAEEARRRQEAFNAAKPGIVSSLKGVSGPVGGPIGLKGATDPRPNWDARISDPMIIPHARKLASVVPPLPIASEEAKPSIDKIFTSAPYRKFEQVYLGEDRLQNTADLVLAGWEIAGVVGARVAPPLHAIIIVGKTFIAGEDAAYMHLVKDEHQYEMAAAFLKDPKRAQEFAHVVDAVRHGQPAPAGSDPLMVQAAQAITDPKLANSGAPVVWDAMRSPEAVSAMLRKFTMETLCEAAGDPMSEGISKVTQKLTSSKVVYELAMTERTYAVKAMAEATDVVQLAQWKAVVEHSNQLLATTYKVALGERAANAVGGKALGEGADALANALMGSTEADAPKYEPEHRQEPAKKNALGLKTE